MKKFLSRLLLIPLAVILAAFLVANRRPASISLDPFSTDDPAIATPALPMWVWLISALFVGYLLGAAGMWASGRPARRRARAAKKELAALKREAQPAAPNITETSGPQTITPD
jgi:hypothetical protein